ncbi:MAG: ornithine carbamoyltransferase [Candidatus Omnitrophica bacterium]|nr:ornithine carbamoyltransferase [Candidatus Omnitrophota bacterium]
MKVKHFISSYDFDAAEMKTIFELTRKIKKNPSAYHNFLKGKVAALIFEKPSTRTRVSFQAGFISLGGQMIYLGPGDVRFGIREEIRDIARSLSPYLDAAILRTFSHRAVVEFAQYFQKPVVNGLSDLEHPCQALSDIFTIEEALGTSRGKKIVYIGDGNNVCHSLLLVAARLGLHFCIAAPKKFQPDASFVAAARKEVPYSKAKIEIMTDPIKAVRGADIVYTDVWVSMGEEDEAESKKKAFREFQINSELLAKAKSSVRVMHCLPAHRGEEITNEVLEGKKSIVFQQAENRLHVQKAILVYLFNVNVSSRHPIGGCPANGRE